MKFSIRSVLTIITLLMLPSGLLAQDIKGLWQTHKTERGTLIVDIHSCGGALCGKIVKAYDPQGTPGDYEHLGKRMIWDMKPTEQPGKWDNGKICWCTTARAAGSEDCGVAKDEAGNSCDHASYAHRIVRTKPQRTISREHVAKHR